jgi:hypothetical protein
MVQASQASLLRILQTLVFECFQGESEKKIINRGKDPKHRNALMDMSTSLNAW